MTDTQSRWNDPTTLLARLRRRQRALNALDGAALGLLCGALVGAVLALITLVRGDVQWPAQPWLPWLCVAAGALVGALLGAARRIDDLHLARAVDRTADSQDRFASALQLAGTRHSERARLVRDDAMKHVRAVATSNVLPARLPKHVRWVALPLAAIALLLLVPGPNPRAGATEPMPEISAEQWAQLSEQFHRELRDLEQPESPEDEELRRRLDELAKMLAERPQKKQALREIADLEQRVRNRRERLGGEDPAMKQAARQASKSEMLRKVKQMLRSGEYKKAAEELKKISEQMKTGDLSPTAAQFEDMAADMQKMAGGLKAADVQDAMERSANAAGSMNREALAKALERLSDAVDDNASRARNFDRLREMQRLLEELRRRMNNQKCSKCNGDGCAACAGGRPGSGLGLVRRPGMGGGKGGHEAGWGSASDWSNGSLDEQDDKRTPSAMDAQQRPGEDSRFRIVSPEERADTGKTYEELYAEFVQKAEADLDLDEVPTSYREFLRRYFNSIRPDQNENDAEPAAGESDVEAPAQP